MPHVTWFSLKLAMRIILKSLLLLGYSADPGWCNQFYSKFNGVEQTIDLKIIVDKASVATKLSSFFVMFSSSFVRWPRPRTKHKRYCRVNEQLTSRDRICSDEGLTLETSAIHQTLKSQIDIISTHIHLAHQRRKICSYFSKLIFQC